MRQLVSFAKRYAVAAGGVGYAFTLGLHSRRHRGLIHNIAKHFGYDTARAPLLPTVSVAEVTREDTTVLLREPASRDGNVTLLELLVLARLVRERAPRALFELGTFDGRTTLNLAANSPPGAVVYTLDLPPDLAPSLALDPVERKYVDKPVPGVRFLGTDQAPKIRQLLGDSATFDFGPYPADFVFIDASHAYEYVLSDSRQALQMLRGGRGTIVWHDYSEWDGVTRALDTLARDAPAFAGLRWIEGTTLAILTRV
jgi:predicted O-methyltransferase YrrM